MLDQVKDLLRTPIIPIRPLFYGKGTILDYRSIAFFSAIGFFLDNTTYYKDLKVVRPAQRIREAGDMTNTDTWFTWHHSPRDISLKQTVEEFAHLFEKIVTEQTGNRRVILPLSGGLDSRTQAAALQDSKSRVMSYSYEFADGVQETRYGELIARSAGFNFRRMVVPRGYLWSCIEQLAAVNHCYTDFTHPRQMAFVDEYSGMGDLFSLGHWGDVLFDNACLQDELSFEEQIDVVLSKVVKKGGLFIGQLLWEAWGQDGEFEEVLREYVGTLLSEIRIEDANARLRAFKSLHWAPRWTSVNANVFAAVKPISLPYYDDRMCEFICTVPEAWLSGRKIQIEYLKIKAPFLARIPWQQHAPFNLYHYAYDTAPWNLPFRIFKKMKHIWRARTGNRLVQRNWELQFQGEENRRDLERWLLGREELTELLPASIVTQVLDKFYHEDPVTYSHPVSMLLTLALFAYQKRGGLH